MKFFDAHTHVNLAAFRDDYKETINRALITGVGMINVGTQKDTSLRAVEIAREFPNDIYAAVGLHPVHTGKSFHDTDELGGGEAAKAFTPLEISPDVMSGLPPSAEAESGFLTGFTSRGEVFDYEYYKKLAADPKVVAIGECGLDYFRIEIDKTDINDIKNKQKAAFVEQIKLANEIKKPLMIHCRAERDSNHAQRGAANAFPDLIKILDSKFQILNSPPGIIHFFTGTKDEAKKLLDLGFYFTFGGVITFVRDYDEVIKSLPMDRILSETDAPYVAPAPYRGKRNEPAYVIEVVKKLAELKSTLIEIMAEQILKNTKNIFKLS